MHIDHATALTMAQKSKKFMYVRYIVYLAQLAFSFYVVVDPSCNITP